MPRLRLVNPKNPLNGLVQGDVARRVTFGRKAIFMPFGLMVAAAAVPRSWQIEIVDECVQSVPVAKDVDLVGITAMTCQAPRAYEIADAYRRLGVPVILGGIHPSCMPEEALLHATAVAVGEAEGTLPRMLEDFAAGRLSGIYRAEAGAEIAAPRRDLLNPRDYLVNNAVQISRGCPMRCKFCTTAAMYGGRYSVRPIEAILQEIRDLGARRVVFADDNVVGNFRWAKAFLKELGRLGIQWTGQATLNIARDDEMLALLKASGCAGLILGLESPNPESLREGHKTVCPAEDYLPLIRKIQTVRIATWGSFLMGFDADTVESLHAAVRFARLAELDISSYPILTPYPGTPLFDEYDAAGRILTRDWAKYTGGTVVFQPKRMTPRELANCQMAAFREFYSWRSMWQRLTLWPFQKWAWIINISINQGLRYYYRRQKKRMPDFQEAHLWAAEAAK
ncbi:MAG: B12-binding domain-containing radical SAM protein [Acidobacteria bacterium]|nr:B12-binding domain-containing radical SAM protein [Planctomycetota bacterium]MBE3133600.1 B12-binding domain-containing radical SAM protein [Acidobacteriota bacterium]